MGVLVSDLPSNEQSQETILKRKKLLLEIPGDLEKRPLSKMHPQRLKPLCDHDSENKQTAQYL